ncbi:MAG: carbohydrate ABC transporter permease [Deltaproteobacteria bacterium]|nr:carbohydrate ABC transporter permease [Deltaproteobacteria bacterium]MBW2123765.1 carbohydrate ABC transporter permease [Deltaproteobacteria bacterium]
MGTRKRIIVYLLASFFVVLVVIPYFWVLTTSFKSHEDIFRLPLELIPRRPVLDNYVEVLFGPENFQRKFLNSLIVTVSTTLVALMISISSAYALARFRIRRKFTILRIILVSQLVPIAVLLVPLYEVFRVLHILDTYYALILGNLAFCVPFAVWLLRSFFLSVPVDIEDAALIDGCSRIQVLIRIVLPVSGPGLVTAAAFIFIYSWQEYIMALTFINTGDKYTLPVALTSFIGQYGTQWGSLMAASVIVTIPVMAMFMLLRRFIVSGVMGGAVKG